MESGTITDPVKHTTPPKASVIIVNYNGGEWLPLCVAALEAQSEAAFEAFIVDNGSSDGSIEALPKLDARFEIIRAGENLGFAAANNLAAKQARAEYLVMLNPDAFARKDWLKNLLGEVTAPDITMVGSLQYMALEPDVLDGAGDFYHASGLAWRGGFGHPASSAPSQAVESFAPCGAGALYHRETFLKLGGYDERFFCYHEDVDLGFRMRLAGGRCVQSVSAIIDHVSSGIAGRASEFAVYHGTRNRIWTFFKNMPLPLLLLLLPAHIGMNLFVLFWAGLRSGRFKPTFRGVRDGIKGLPNILQSRRDLRPNTVMLTSDVARMFIWAVGPVRKRAVPDYHPASPDE